MRVPGSSYQVEPLLSEHLPTLRPAERRGLALWVLGAILAGSACQNAVLAALEPRGLPWHATRQRLREWTYAGPERTAGLHAERQLIDGAKAAEIAREVRGLDRGRHERRRAYYGFSAGTC